MDSEASTALREENIARTVTLEMITIRKLRRIPRKMFLAMTIEIEEIIENWLHRGMSEIIEIAQEIGITLIILIIDVFRTF